MQRPYEERDDKIIVKIEDRDKKSPIALYRKRKRVQHEFNRDEIHIEKAGKKIYLNQFIQDGREDTEIYPMLEKYNNNFKVRTDLKAIQEDLTGFKDMRTVLEQENYAKKIWDNLPLQVRNEFNNSKYEFLEKGEQWIKNKLEEQRKKIEENKQEVTNNE